MSVIKPMTIQQHCCLSFLLLPRNQRNNHQPEPAVVVAVADLVEADAVALLPTMDEHLICRVAAAMDEHPICGRWRRWSGCR